jgi:hydroxybutyrate-dimer hydrolase
MCRCFKIVVSAIVPAALTLAASVAVADSGFASRIGTNAWNVSCLHYDGKEDDLLTGGLGATGLQGAAPLPGNPLAPTAAELRRLAIYSSYRGLIDVSPGGGFGTLYGPTVSNDGDPDFNKEKDGRIAGLECLAYANPRSGHVNTTMMVQVPDSFDQDTPCLVVGPTSGQRGIYGANGTSGEWGLKQKCAVAYTDKGGGSGVDDLGNGLVSLIDGVRTAPATAGKLSNFTAPLAEAKRQQFNSEWPNRFAFKFAHSKQNPEAQWGRMYSMRCASDLQS